MSIRNKKNGATGNAGGLHSPDIQELESYRRQKLLDDRKRQLDALPQPSDAEKLERLWADVGTHCQTFFFSLPDCGPTIEQIKSDIAGLCIIAQVGKSYCVSMPANDESLGKFNRLYGNVPDPAAEDMTTLEQDVNQKLSKGFFSPSTE